MTSRHEDEEDESQHGTFEENLRDTATAIDILLEIIGHSVHLLVSEHVEMCPRVFVPQIARQMVNRSCFEM